MEEASAERTPLLPDGSRASRITASGLVNIGSPWRETEENDIRCRNRGTRVEHSESVVEDHDGIIRKALETETLNAQLESLDYDNCENEVFLEDFAKKTPNQLLRQRLARWVVMFLIGVLTALVACCIDISIGVLSHLKFKLIEKYYDICMKSNCLVLPLLLWIAWNVIFVGMASLLTTYGEPIAAGSGIPQIKCFLNGVKIPRVVRIKTLICKVIGVIFSVLGGLCIGKEGPMIHSGSVIAAGISQGRSTTFGFDLRLFHYFRTDTEKRDFVSGGAAAGVSAAFGAPVGGVLFSLEEGASFWNQALTWRIFFASMVTTFTLNSVLSFYHGVPWKFSYPGLINFGKFPDIQYDGTEIPIYVIMGVIGGFFGALFNFINYRITLFRRRNIPKKWMKVIEASLVAAVSAAVAFLLILIIDDCQPVGQDPNKYPLQMYCGDGMASSMSVLWFQSPEESVKSLFHDPYGTYNPVTLVLFGLCYFFLACWTYGVYVPSGLFIPGLVIGAAWGRLFGILMKIIFPALTWVDPGKFALIGAAAQLGGIVRMTLSLTVILIEATGDIGFGLPLMIVLMVAKWTGDIFNEGIYDAHIHLQDVPILGWEPPPLTSNIVAREVMSHPVVTLNTVDSVARVVDMLTVEHHDGFPVVKAGNEIVCENDDCQPTFGILSGLITRSQLIVLLRHKHFVGQESCLPEFGLDAFREIYPRFPKVQDVDITDEDRKKQIDLTSIMNPAPYAVFDNTSLPRIFKLFRGLGLRHLVVVDRKNQACVSYIQWYLDLRTPRHTYISSYMLGGIPLRSGYCNKKRSGQISI